MNIDVIVPVFNALSQTSRCLESVLRHSSGDYRLIVVNDCSDVNTTDHLRSISAHPRVLLMENPENLGFLQTANSGMRRSLQDTAVDAVILLNSDTIVSEGWLDSFRDCFSSDSTIGLATAVSNNAQNLSITLPPGYHVHNFAPIVRRAGKKIGFPDVTTAIGFCMGIRREVLDKVGFFDEIFGRGYGEDSDYHFQVLSAGYRSVLVSTCFVYHEHHASFSDSALVQVAKNRPIFDQRWSTIYMNELQRHDRDRPIERLEEAIREEMPKERLHDVLFILPTPRLFGGIIVVYEIVNRLVDSGLDVGVIIANGEENIQMELCFAPYFLPPTEWRSGVPRARCYVATHFETCAFALAASELYPEAKLAYLVQGYESWFPEAVIEKVVDTYRAIPNRIVVSEWLKEMLKRWGCDASVLPNGVDSKMFVPPADRWTPARRERPCTVLTMLRHDPQGGWRFTFGILEKLKKLRPDVQVIAVGELSSHPDVRPFVDEAYKSADRKTMRKLFQSADLFFDTSMVQGFGLMGLEAMSSGVAVVTSATGGVREYASEENAMLVPVGNENALLDALLKLIDQADLRERLSRAGYETARAMDWWNITAGYEEYFRELLSRDSGPVTLSDVRPRHRFFIEEFLRGSEHENWLLQAMHHFRRELDSAYIPLSARQVLTREKREDLIAKLSKFSAGASLLEFYDAAAAAVTRSAHHRIAPSPDERHPGGFLNHVRTIVPNHAAAVRGKGHHEAN